MMATAVSIFALDALIDNPDRKFSPNPNLFSRGDTIFVFDHELAFSFMLDISPSPLHGNWIEATTRPITLF